MLEDVKEDEYTEQTDLPIRHFEIRHCVLTWIYSFTFSRLLMLFIHGINLKKNLKNSTAGFLLKNKYVLNNLDTKFH